MQQLPIVQPEAAPFNGPQCIRASLLSGIGAAPYEGLWTPTNFLKTASIESVTSGGLAFTLNLFGSNSDVWPMNTYTVVVGASAITAGDVATLTFNPALSGIGSISAAYTVGSSDNPTSIAAALTAEINANTSLIALQITATSTAGVITISWPSTASVNLPSSFNSPSNVSLANFLSVTGSVSGAATETLTIGLGTDGSPLGIITAPGLIQISQWPARWIKARLSGLVGTNTPLISAKLHGVA